MKALGLDFRGAEKRSNEGVGREQGASVLPDSSDDAVLIGESVATGLEDDLLERGHRLRLRGEADGVTKTRVRDARLDPSPPNPWGISGLAAARYRWGRVELGARTRPNCPERLTLRRHRSGPVGRALVKESDRADGARVSPASGEARGLPPVAGLGVTPIVCDWQGRW